MIGRASLRTRLALLYAALAVVVLAISLLTVYGFTRHETLNRVDNSLRVDARNLGSRAEGSEHGSESPSTERFVNAREAVAAGHLLALVDDHKIVASNSDARLLLAEARSQNMLDGHEHVATLHLPDGSFRIASVPIDAGEYALAAAPLQPFTESEEGLLHATIIAGAVGIVLTFIGAWVATRRGLRPLETITSLANEVAPDALSLRTGLKNQDEIGAVAGAIDRMLNRLQAAFDAQQQFLEDASHELRTPLTIARGHLELLEENPEATATERNEALEVAIDEIDRMARLVDGLLQLARATETERLSIVQVAVEPLLESIASQFRRLHTRDWTVAAPGDLLVSADPDVLRQIILNLARNADEHSPEMTPVELTAAADDGHVRISVSDRGSGIDPAIRGRLFNRFAHDGTGVGLGLAISKALVEAQNGTIALDDRPGGGTTATVTLPRP